MLLNILCPWLTRQNTCLYDSMLLEKMLAIGLYCQAHGNFYVTIASNFNFGKTIIIEAVEDALDALCDIKHEYIKFPSMNRGKMATRQTFKNLSNLPNVLGAIDTWPIKIKTPIESRPDYLVDCINMMLWSKLQLMKKTVAWTLQLAFWAVCMIHEF